MESYFSRGSTRGYGPGAGDAYGAGFGASRPSYSEMVASYNRGFGSGAVGGRGDSSTTDRPFQLVGKNRINLLDPLDRQREQQRLFDQYGIERPAHEGPLGFVEDYYDPANPAGVVGGLIGAAGQTLGGIFGEGGAKFGTEIGGLIGKTLDVPFNVFSQLPLPTFFLPFVDDANHAIEQNTPYIWHDVAKIPKTAGDAVSSLLNLLGMAGRGVERTVAGNRQLPEDLKARVDAGEISADDAYDMMVVEGRGYTDDPMSNLLMSIAFDPVNWATLGVGAVGAAAKGGIGLADLATKGGKFLNAAEHGAELGRIGDIARSGLVQESDIAKLSRLDSYRLRTTLQRRALSEADHNPLVNYALLARMHLVPASREVLGHVDEITQNSNLFYRAAKKAIDVTDPVTFMGGRLFGTGSVGKRQMEMLATTAQSAVFSAHGPGNIRRLTEIADTAPGGSNTILDALGVHAGNTAQEFSLGEHVGDGLRAGKVPVLSGTNGHSLSPTEAARAILRGGAYDTNVGKHMELLIHKNKPAMFVRAAGETKEMLDARVLAESRSKLQSLLGPEWDPNTLKAGDLSEDMAALIHSAYYYGTGAKFYNEVVPAMQAAKAAGTLPPTIADPERLTMLTERQLTAQRAEAVEAAIKAKNVDVLRSLISKYREFDWLDGSKVDGQDLIDKVQDWLNVNKATLSRELDLTDPATGVRYAGLPKELDEWLADADKGFGYTLAEGPPANVPRPDLYGAVRNADGVLEGMVPWLDFLPNPSEIAAGAWAAGKAPSKVGSYLSNMTQHIRQERIRWEGRRRFITDMSKGSDSNGLDVAPAASHKLWNAIMSEAEHQRVQPRGLGPEDFARIVRASIADAKKVQDGQTLALENLSHHQVMNALLRATQGDLWTVGGTQWFTGRWKTYMPGAGQNLWGQIAEKLYPTVRFALNPVFQVQELAEPYILNRMRGVAAPLDRNSAQFKEALATHNAIMKLARTSMEPDGMLSESAEYLRLYAADYLGTRQAFGANTWWGRFSAKMRPGIGERKAALAALEAKQLFGDRFYRTGLSLYGETEWRARFALMEQDALSLDKGDVAMKWMALNMHLSDANGSEVEDILDLLNPHNLGKRLRVTHAETPGAMTFAQIERTIDGVEQYNDGRTVPLYRQRTDAAGKPFAHGGALLDELRTTSEADWMLRGKGIKGIVADDEALRTIWRMANAPEPDQFWSAYRKALLTQVQGTSRSATRAMRDAELERHKALLRIFAGAEGLTEGEYIARHFQPNDYVRTFANATNVPPGALLDMRPDWLPEVLSRTDFDVSDLRTVGEDADTLRRVSPVWSNMDDYHYKVIPIEAVPRVGGQEIGMPAAKAYRGWGDIDDAIDEARLDGGTIGSTVVRLPKSAEGKYAFRVMDDKHAVLSMDTNMLEVYDARTRTWRPLRESRPYTPQVPAHLQPNEGVRALYVAPGVPETEVGLYPVDIDAYLERRHGISRDMYKGDAYAAINAHLRGYPIESDLPIEVLDRAVDDLTELINKGTLPQRTTLYRGVNLSRIEHEFPDTPLTVDYENLDKGDIIDDAAFQSFSDELDKAGHFAEGGGHRYQKEPGRLHKSVYVHLDAPPGMPIAYLQGREREHLVGAEQKLSIIRRTKREYMGERGVPHVQYDFYVEPVGYPKQPRINRLMLDELTPTQQVNTRVVRDAMTGPDALRALAEERTQDVGLMGRLAVDEAIDAAAKNLPPTQRTVVESLADDLAELDPEDLDGVGRVMADLRLRMQDIGGSNSMGMRLVHSLAYAVSTEAGMELGWKELVRRLEALWDEGPASANTASREAIDRALFKGVKNPQRIEPLDSVVSDTLDVMLGNRSRRAVGRGEVDEPVIVDQLTMMDAGYPEGTTPNAYTHEYVVDFYNRKAREANASMWGGRKDWSASEMAQLGQLRMQRRLGKTGIAVDMAEVDRLTHTLPVGVYPPPDSALAPYAPLLDIYFQPEHREKLVGLMDELGLTVGQQMRDELGLPVLNLDGSGIGYFDGGAPQAMVPVTIIASDGRADDAADVLSYITGAEVWSFTPSVVDDLTDLTGLTPRLKITIPDQGSDEWTKEFATTLASLLGARGEMRGATARRINGNDWALDIIDEGGVFKRLDDGALDFDDVQTQLDLAVDHMDEQGLTRNMDEVTFEEEYGSTYHAGPPKLDDGTTDWEGHHAATAGRLQERGSRVTGDDLHSLRTTYEYTFRQRLEDDAPKQVRRARNHEPLRPGVLEDRRGGSVRGYTDFGADDRAVIGALNSADPLTGIHELMHVHARTLDPSAKARVMASHDADLAVKRDDLTKQVAALRVKAAGTRSARWRTQWTNDANALESQLGGMVHLTDWGAEHEEYLVQQFMRYIHQSRSPNPEMTNVMEHFRVWTDKLKKELFPGGEGISPEMTAFFDSMFRKKTRDMTVPYSVEHETLRMAMKQQLRDSWDEAHGTHYYRKDRRWFERTANHPYIGMYPASYMWGKMLPEMVRFLALRPFGYETPLLAWNVLREVSDTMRYQSETNDDFRTFLKDNDRAFMLFSMLFPSVPNDIASNASLPLRRIAEQSLMNQYKNAQGIPFGKGTGEIKDIDYLSGLEDAVNYAIGPLGALRTGGEVIGMGQKMLEGAGAEKRDTPLQPLDMGGLPGR